MDVDYSPYWSSFYQVTTKTLTQKEYIHIYYFIKICKNWKLIIGNNLFEKVIPTHLKKNNLTLITEDSSYAEHIRRRENILLSQIGATLQKNYCEKISVFVGEIKNINKQYIKNCQKDTQVL